MEGKSQNETEKIKKIQEAELEVDEVKNHEDGKSVESFGKDPSFEAPTVVNCLPAAAEPHPDEESETETDCAIEERRDSYADKKRLEMKMKWMMATGKKPFNILNVKEYAPEVGRDIRTVTFFGERRPASVEKCRRENWLRIYGEREKQRHFKNEGRILREIRFSDTFLGLRCLRFSPDSANMAASFGNGIVQIRRADNGEILLNLQTMESIFVLEVLALRYHPKISTKLYIGGGSGSVQVFDTSKSQLLASVNEKNNEICNLDLSPDGSVLVSVGRDANIYIYDSQSLRLVSLRKKPGIDENATTETELKYHHMRIFGLRYHPTEPNIFVTGGWDNTVKVWDTRVCGAVNTIHGPRICGDSIDVRGNEILTGSWTPSNSLKIWDLTSGKIIQNVSIMNRSSPVDGEFIYVAKFFTGKVRYENAVIVGGNGSDEVQIINLQNNLVVATFPSMKAVTALDNYDEVIAYGGMESLLRIGDLRCPSTSICTTEQSSSSIRDVHSFTHSFAARAKR